MLMHIDAFRFRETGIGWFVLASQLTYNFGFSALFAYKDLKRER